ncbi:complex I NDUFA9 subunit family protein [Pseudoduganella violacea]|uniref:NADH dehydrogenase n=1 Tax=Pseudoduganella violacea TaxID=1715466 RepID=A0A7W5BEX5_9BURK|nr:complex I NDUFA9 subunit family protein [Pseudoduganella violacea]MBB3121906.1 NADH dehydrogenase [Pseudoduganella violacea]
MEANVVVIGGTGFIGSHIVAKLSAEGADVLVPTRREEHGRHLLALPRVGVVPADVHEDGALRGLLQGQGRTAVINLVGVLHCHPGQPYGPEFARAHVELPRRIVAACAAAGVARYLHMSALGAAADGPSMYLRSKADGELAARSNPAVSPTIFRPSVVFGPDDHFINLFAALQRRLPVLPLACAAARFQPVFVEDVAQAFVDALSLPQTRGQVVELAGPKIYTLEEIVRLAGSATGHPRPIVALPPTLARIQAFLLEHMPGTPLMSRDNLDSMRRDNVLAPNTQALVAEDLGIPPTALEAVAPHYAARLRNDEFRSRAGR